MNEWKRQERNYNRFVTIIEIITVVFFIIGLIFITNGFGLFDRYIWKTGNAKIDHDVYKNSSSYIDGKVSMLSQQKRDFEKAESIDNKIIIINYIKEELDNFDLDDIENENLKKFAEDIFNGKYDNLEDN
jgi:hypothetical protein